MKKFHVLLNADRLELKGVSFSVDNDRVGFVQFRQNHCCERSTIFLSAAVDLRVSSTTENWKGLYQEKAALHFARRGEEPAEIWGGAPLALLPINSRNKNHLGGICYI